MHLRAVEGMVVVKVERRLRSATGKAPTGRAPLLLPPQALDGRCRSSLPHCSLLADRKAAAAGSHGATAHRIQLAQMVEVWVALPLPNHMRVWRRGPQHRRRQREASRA